MNDNTIGRKPERTHLGTENAPLCGVYAEGADAFTEDINKVDCVDCQALYKAHLSLAARKPVECERCGWKGTQGDLELKMSGSLCPKCRYVVLPKDSGLTIPMAQIHVCGPSTPKCRCNCARKPGDCEHVWDGPWEVSDDGLEGTVTCSRCGMWASDHDLWVLP